MYIHVHVYVSITAVWSLPVYGSICSLSPLSPSLSLLQVEALTSENANCTMLNVSGHTPLDLACQGGHAQVGKLL